MFFISVPFIIFGLFCATKANIVESNKNKNIINAIIQEIIISVLCDSFGLLEIVYFFSFSSLFVFKIFSSVVSSFLSFSLSVCVLLVVSSFCLISLLSLIFKSLILLVLFFLGFTKFPEYATLSTF